MDIELDYYESYYSSTNTQNAFPSRQKFYMIKRSGAGANNISVDVSNALHTDGTNKVIISPFQQGDLLVDTSKWEWGWYYFNTTVKYYPKNTNLQRTNHIFINLSRWNSYGLLKLSNHNH